MTGAVLPSGADRVLPFEATDRGRERVRRIDLAAAPLSSGTNVRPRGEVARAGDRLLEVGRRIGPPELAVAASVGITRLSTIAGLTAAIVVTGDEVVAPEETPTASEVRDSHGAFLLAECGAAGVAAEHLGIVRDDPESLERVLRRGLAHDLLVVTGGVSAGEFDFVEPILARLGARVIFEGLAIQPGKPVVAARLGRTVILGLPGNPASAIVVWWLVGRALVRRLSGEPDATPWQGATWLDLGAPAPGAGTRDRFLPARLSIERGRRIATPISARGSHDLFAYARADVLLRVRAGDSARATGALIEGIELRVCGLLDPARFPGRLLRRRHLGRCAGSEEEGRRGAVGGGSAWESNPPPTLRNNAGQRF